MRTIVLAAGIAAIVASPAFAAANLNHATDGFTYFHRAGATMEAHDAQMRACLKESRFHQPSPNSGQYAAGHGLAGVIAGVIVDVAIAAMQAPKIRANNLENCMTVHGWNVMLLPEAEGAPLEALKQPELHAKLETMVGAEAPQGNVAATYANDLVSDAVVAFATIGSPGKSLSYAALPDAPKDEAEEAAEEPAAEDGEPKVEKASATKGPKLPKKPKTANPPAPTPLAKLPAVPEGSALLLARITDQQVAPTYAFRRVGADPLMPAWVDGQPAEANVTMPMAGFWKLKPVAEDGFIAVIVPPGQWVLDSVSLGLMGVHLCYGAPAIEVAAGDVLYLGAFEQKALAPNMDLEAAKAALAARPELAGKLTAASYTNGHKGSCGGVGYGYAMEIPGAPYVDGYALGSKANVAVAAAAPAEVVPVAAAEPAAPVEPAPAAAEEAAPAVPEQAPAEPEPTAETVA
ncbi:MAG TPA: hypothetical protein VD906_00195 [Caulobacteraceae bacterium]|nr:hypothetical protein [Caulobacteraceae bacterium]